MNYAVEKWTRRAALTAIGAVAALGLGTGTANADMLADLAKQAAASEHPVVWYESSQEDQIEKVIAAFNQRYPDVKVEHLRVLGGNKMTGRVIQEIQGQGYSGDLVTTGADQAWEMNGRGLLQEANWGELGVPAKLTPEPFTVAMAASVYVLLVNTDKVKPEDEPKGWQDVKRTSLSILNPEHPNFVGKAAMERKAKHDEAMKYGSGAPPPEGKARSKFSF